MTRTATAADVRKFHKSQGNDVRISRDGIVQYREDAASMWMCGRWVEDYKVDAITGKIFA